MTYDNTFAKARLVSIRLDRDTERIIDTAIAMVLTDGLEMAERYLRDRGIPMRTELRVLTPNMAMRRRTHYR